MDKYLNVSEIVKKYFDNCYSNFKFYEKLDLLPSFIRKGRFKFVAEKEVLEYLMVIKAYQQIGYDLNHISKLHKKHMFPKLKHSIKRLFNKRNKEIQKI